MNPTDQTQRATFKVSFFLNANKARKNGEVPIMGRITINGEIANFSTKISIPTKMWDVSTMSAIGRSAEASKINTLLESIKGKIHGDFHFLQGRDGDISAEKLKNCFLGLDQQYETLLSLFDKHIVDLKQRVPHDLSQSAFKKYLLTRRRIEQFMKERYNYSDLSLKSIRLMFIEDFAHWLRNRCKLDTNVLAKDIQLLKKIITIAHKNGIISVHPFAEYTIKKVQKDRGYLNKQELESILKKEIESLRLEQIRDIFIFSCYTGLAYCDVSNLTEDHIQPHIDGNLWLKFNRQKTGFKSDLPLLAIPKMIIDKYRNQQKNGKLLPVPSNQKVNAYLKEIGEICGIKQPLTFHIARHTFATTIALANGISMESLSGMLGHNKITTTQIYGKITRDKIGKEMAGLEGKLDKQEQLFQTTY